MKAGIQKKLNEQINKELVSAYLYLDFANYFGMEGLDGFEHYFRVQAVEERDHAMKIIQYLLDNDVKVELGAIEAPGGSYESVKLVLEAALDHEKFITDSIHAISIEATKEKDLRTVGFLQWFIEEQAEEEKNASDLIRKYELYGLDGKGLYELNAELGARQE